jgi:hypothetical protein
LGFGVEDIAYLLPFIICSAIIILAYVLISSSPRHLNRSLPVTDPTLLLSLQRAAINAQNHGLDMCLNEEELDALQRMANEVKSVEP